MLLILASLIFIIYIRINTMNIILTESQFEALKEHILSEIKVLDGADSTKMGNGSSQVGTSVPIHDTDGNLDQKKAKDVTTDEISHTLSGYRLSDVRRY